MTYNRLPYPSGHLRSKSTSVLRQMKDELLVYQRQSNTTAALHEYYQVRIDAIVAELARRNPPHRKRGSKK